MIILKVKDVETDDDSLEMPEWMNNAHDVESDGSEASSDFNSDISSDSSSESSSEDEAKEQKELCDDENQEDADNSSDNAASSLFDDMDEEPDGFDLFPAYHLPDNMDTSDDEETAMARGCWYWYLYDKGYVTFPSHTNRVTDSEGKAGTGSTSGTDEKSKIPDDSSSKICDASTTDEPVAILDEATAEKSTSSITLPLDA